MNQGFPITIVADGQFSDSLKPLLIQLEMWINFQALKAEWYCNEDFILSFDFTLVKNLEEKQLTAAREGSAEGTESWVVESGYAYHYESSRLTTIAFIAVDDLLQDSVGIEQAIKARLIAVTNAVATSVGSAHDLLPLS
ncbi:hypothetical protein HWQ46_05650 [Shewanella sp. D64]|uniref:hypothetical protein n=1 Tax=unclassified Shewanella TaxID=196818 RepID=UPI0022BA22F2|nr:MULTISPECIES: hypothetical protein [unclassified Shewanella]MEC4725036.1 hypothetical protein [Shewanella sp. D64]MEC4736937.1 hypothetical protein [Shewanella sp. E94]WBJ96532.1 hypothetical protein HWQ47_05255 [Shewanella sp. MTB7]